MPHQLALSVSITSFLIIAMGLVYKKHQRMSLTEPLVAMLIGILIGPQVLQILDMAQWGRPEVIMDLTTQFTIAMAVMAAALRVPKSYPSRDKGYQSVVLLLIMPLMALSSGMLIYWLTDLPLILSCLIGAVLTPTDPVVSATIVSGDIAEENLTGRIRDGISFESGANDGLAFPIVMLFVLLLESQAEAVLGEWVLKIVLWETVVAIGMGILIGWVTGKLLHRAHKAGWTSSQSLLSFSLAVTFFTLTFCSLIQVNGLIATFVAGLMHNQVFERREDLQQERVLETMERLFTVPVFVLFGLILPFAEWWALGWSGALVVGAVLLLRRLPWFLLLRPLLPGQLRWADAALIGWFGPIGVAAIFYAFHALQRTGFDIIWTLTSLVVFTSTVIHGLSSYPLGRYYKNHFKDPEQE